MKKTATQECFLVAQGYSRMSRWSVEKDPKRTPGIAWNCFNRNSWPTKPEEGRHRVLTVHGKSEEVGLPIHEAHVTRTHSKEIQQHPYHYLRKIEFMSIPHLCHSGTKELT